MLMILVGIDVGYVNMGVVRVVLDDVMNFSFTHAFRYDLTVPKHNRVHVSDCTIPHTNETCDRFAHFIQENSHIFDEADCIIVERQPPMGLKDIEALIMHYYRNKVKLISPSQMHKHFRIKHLDYEQRKEEVVGIATRHVEHIDTFTNQVRQHDIADAVCFCIYHITKIKDDMHRKERLENIRRLPFDEYAFIPPREI